jgi:hypothetical protein
VTCFNRCPKALRLSLLRFIYFSKLIYMVPLSHIKPVTSWQLDNFWKQWHVLQQATLIDKWQNLMLEVFTVLAFPISSLAMWIFRIMWTITHISTFFGSETTSSFALWKLIWESVFFVSNYSLLSWIYTGKRTTGPTKGMLYSYKSYMRLQRNV